MSDDHRAGVPISDAAERLGVTIELLRKRAQRGTMPAYKVDGRWFVVLDTTEHIVQPTSPGQDVQDVPSRTGQSAEPPQPPRSVTPAAMSQLEAIREEWLQPLIDRVGSLERTLGRTEEQRDAANRKAERERIEKEQERAGRILAEQKLEEANAELVILREIRRHDEPDPETRTMPLIASPADPGREEAVSTAPSTLHAPSLVVSAWRRLRRRT